MKKIIRSLLLFLILIIGPPNTKSIKSHSEEKANAKVTDVLYFLIFTFVLIMPFFFIKINVKKQN